MRIYISFQICFYFFSEEVCFGVFLLEDRFLSSDLMSVSDKTDRAGRDGVDMRREGM